MRLPSGSPTAAPASPPSPRCRVRRPVEFYPQFSRRVRRLTPAVSSGGGLTARQDSNFHQVCAGRSRQGGSSRDKQGTTTMLNHVSIGVRDVARSKRFYDAALAPLGYACLSQSPDALGYGGDGVCLWIGATDQPVPANAKSGLHVLLFRTSRQRVDAFHAAALVPGRTRSRFAGPTRRLREQLLCRLRH